MTLLLISFESHDILLTGPGHAKTCLMSYANNKGADQPAHPRSLTWSKFSEDTFSRDVTQITDYASTSAITQIDEPSLEKMDLIVVQLVII